MLSYKFNVDSNFNTKNVMTNNSKMFDIYPIISTFKSNQLIKITSINIPPKKKLIKKLNDFFFSTACQNSLKNMRVTLSTLSKYFM